MHRLCGCLLAQSRGNRITGTVQVRAPGCGLHFLREKAEGIIAGDFVTDESGTDRPPLRPSERTTSASVKTPEFSWGPRG